MAASGSQAKVAASRVGRAAQEYTYKVLFKDVHGGVTGTKQ